MQIFRRSSGAPAGAGPSAATLPSLSPRRGRKRSAQRALGKHQPGAISWRKAIDQYLDFVKRNRRPHTHHEYALTLKGYFPFGNTNLGDITKLDISQKLAWLKDTPSQQNHAAVYAKIFFNWAISEGCLETNPLQHFKQGKKVPRKRILTDDELRAAWSAAGEIGGIFAVIVQLIMLTGQRRGEIAAWLESYYSHNQQTSPGAHVPGRGHGRGAHNGADRGR